MLILTINSFNHNMYSFTHARQIYTPTPAILGWIP